MQLKQVTVEFPTRRGPLRAVNDVSLRLFPGERLGLVGESGSGKSMTLLTILRLIPHPGRLTAGSVHYRERDLVRLGTGEMRSLRGKELAMIFQDPMTTLNPVFKVGHQIRESLQVHNMFVDSRRWFAKRGKKTAERERVLELMHEVGIPSAEERYECYPHEFSGGMLQRAMIAIGLACNPQVLLADEPTTALDVTVQAQIMALLDKINEERKNAIVLVTHDLSLAAEFCSRIAVMYAGSIVERGTVDQVIDRPRHPYTRGLLNALPRLRFGRRSLQPIPGEIDMAALPSGCAFAPRCADSRDSCWQEAPRPMEVDPGHKVACFLCAGGPA